MKFNYSHIAMAILLCAGTAACNRVELPGETGNQAKSPITLSVGGVDSSPVVTKAVVTDGTTNTDFGRDTKVFILMRSDKDTETHGGFEYQGSRSTPLYSVSRGDVVYSTSHTALEFDSVNQKYWDDAHARSSQLSLWAIAQRIATSTDRAWKSVVFQETGDPNNPSVGSSVDAGFNTTVRNDWVGTSIYPAIYTWSVGNPHQNQDNNTLIYQDLLFSNNIADYTTQEWVDKNLEVGRRKDYRLKFNFETRKFPETTELKFYHAMSKITLKIYADEGFKGDGNDFELKSSTIDELNFMNTRGLFNIKDGEFQTIHASAQITAIPLTETIKNNKAQPYYTLQALAIPNIEAFMQKHSAHDNNSRFVKDDSRVILRFTIDNNQYEVTSGALYNALHVGGDPEAAAVSNATQKSDNGTYIPLEAGKNYVFSFRVSKTKMSSITARVADWEDVNAVEVTPSNARITLYVEDRTVNTTAVTENMDIYRSLDEAGSIVDNYVGYRWTTGYNTDGKATWQGEDLEYNSTKWSTDWYWDSNKSYYHIRTISPNSQVVNTDASKGDYTPIYSAEAANAESYNAMAWGAPFKDVDSDYKFIYSPELGFDGKAGHQIYQAIGPTENEIKVLMFHMFSGVHFQIKTSDDAYKVMLYKSDGSKRTKVEMIGYYPEGKVRLGTGLVDASGTISTPASPYDVPFKHADSDGAYVAQDYYLSAIPQSLTAIKLHITTPDNNTYIVDLGKARVSSISQKNIKNPYEGTNVIDRWYPGFKYNYSFTLKKSGILDLNATVTAWEDVTAENEDITIK